MRYKYFLTTTARDDLRSARKWYNEQKVKNLGNRFAKAVHGCILRIQTNPHAYAIRYRSIRIAHTSIFPYNLHFYIDNDMVVITAIIFRGRNPEISSSRTEMD